MRHVSSKRIFLGRLMRPVGAGVRVINDDPHSRNAEGHYQPTAVLEREMCVQEGTLSDISKDCLADSPFSTIL